MSDTVPIFLTFGSGSSFFYSSIASRSGQSWPGSTSLIITSKYSSLWVPASRKNLILTCCSKANHVFYTSLVEFQVKDMDQSLVVKLYRCFTCFIHIVFFIKFNIQIFHVKRFDWFVYLCVWWYICQGN